LALNGIHAVTLYYSQIILYHPVVQLIFTLPDNLQTLSLETDKPVCTKTFHQFC